MTNIPQRIANLLSESDPDFILDLGPSQIFSQVARENPGLRNIDDFKQAIIAYAMENELDEGATRDAVQYAEQKLSPREPDTDIGQPTYDDYDELEDEEEDMGMDLGFEEPEVGGLDQFSDRGY
jgi:hypothetical protein